MNITKALSLDGGEGEGGGEGGDDSHEYVDLGLPSGTLWATCNIGASIPEEDGLYFAWGETQGYTGVTENKQFNTSDYNPSMQEDFVTVILGSNWRLPTRSEFEELLANTDVAKQGNLFILTSKNNGNQVTFRGYIGTISNGYCYNEDGYTFYWSSTDGGTPKKLGLVIYDDRLSISSKDIFNGCSVRPVRV